MSRPWKSVVALSGGVGGARMLHGLAGVLAPDALTAIVNTGDDFRHWGLYIAPDLDTVMYTLAGLSHEARGWGLAEESFHALAMVERYGGSGWFQLGDRDLATHIVRTDALARGQTLSSVTRTLCAGLGVEHRVLPMADVSRPTLIDTVELGTLPFQEWLVGKRAPAVTRIRFGGDPIPAPGVLAAIEAAELVVITPSNPYVSIDPILCLEGVRDAVARRPVICVSPIVGGKAVKGPLAEMIRALSGDEPSAAAVADHYGELVDGFVLESGDRAGVRALGTSTIMGGKRDRERLAAELLAFAETIL